MPIRPTGLRARDRRATRYRWLLLFAAIVLVAPTQPGSAEEECPAGNLLAGRAPQWWAETLQLERLNDGVFGREGAPVPSDLTTILTSERAEVRFDLGRVQLVDSARLQGDGHAAFQVEASDDGVRWRPLWLVPQLREGDAGLHTRSASELDARVRYVRLRPLYRHAVSELALYCGDAPSAPPASARRPSRVAPREDPSQDNALARLAIGVLALAGFGALRLPVGRVRPGLLGLSASLVAFCVAIALAPSPGAWLLLASAPLLWLSLGALRAREAGLDGRPRLRLATLAILSVTAICAWTNFGHFKYTTSLHYWDSFHYVLGARYFPENRYELLYDCVTQAQGESGHWQVDRGRLQRNLRDNQPQSAGAVLDSPERCSDRYSPERWSDFQRDVAFFSSRISPEQWKAMLRDHGYNATPLWTTLARMLIGEAPLSDGRLAWLAAIDVLLYVAAFGIIAATFGAEAAALALLVLGLGHPWRFDWTGGAVGRVPWFFLSVATLCALERGRYGLAGASLAGAAALRVFPLLFGLALGLRALIEARRERRLAERWRRALGSGALAMLLLGGVSALCVGPGAWSEFARNADKHIETSLGNYMGASAAVATLFRGPREEPGTEATRAGRALPTFAYLGLALLIFGTILEAARRRSEATILFTASLLAPIGAVDLTCYYYAFLVLLAPLAVARFCRVAALLTMVVATQAVELMGPDGPGLYAAQTVIVLGAAVYVVWDTIKLGVGSASPALAPPGSTRRGA